MKLRRSDISACLLGARALRAAGWSLGASVPRRAVSEQGERQITAFVALSLNQLCSNRATFDSRAACASRYGAYAHTHDTSRCQSGAARVCAAGGAAQDRLGRDA